MTTQSAHTLRPGQSIRMGSHVARVVSVVDRPMAFVGAKPSVTINVEWTTGGVGGTALAAGRDSRVRLA